MKRNKFLENLLGLKQKEIKGVKANWFGKIKSQEEALATIYMCGRTLILVGLFLGILITILLNEFTEFSICAIITIIFGFLLIIFKSRVAAILLCILEALNFILICVSGDGKTIIALAMLWLSIRSIIATFKYHKFSEQLFNSMDNTEND